MRGSRGGTGGRTPLENRKNTGFLSNTDPDPLKIHKATKPRFNVGTATSFFLPHQNLAKSHHLSSGAKDSKPLKYKNTDIREQNIYNYD